MTSCRSRFLRRRLRPSSLLLAVLVMVALGVASCAGGPPPAAPAPLSAAPANACKYPTTKYEEFCQTVTAAGKQFRYLLFRAEPATTDTMIYDGGGPGVSNLSSIAARYEQVAAGAWARRLNLLVLDEPWVAAPFAPGCRSTMNSFYQASAREYPRVTDASAVRRDCLVGNASAADTPDAYRVAVDEIERAEQVRVVRLEGYSFAAARAAYLGRSHPDMVVAVSSPFPVGAQAADFYAAVGAGRKVPRATARGGLTADSAVAYYLSTGTSPDEMDPAKAAAALWQVNSDGDMSLSRVGYYAEICSTLTGWPALLGAGHQAGSAVTALAGLHAPCAGETPVGLELPRRTCFTVVRHDPNSPWVPSPVTRLAQVEFTAGKQHGRARIPSCR